MSVWGISFHIDVWQSILSIVDYDTLSACRRLNRSFARIVTPLLDPCARRLRFDTRFERIIDTNDDDGGQVYAIVAL